MSLYIGNQRITTVQKVSELGANFDLSNLSDTGNARLIYEPFIINNGSINSSGNNNTLQYSGSTLYCQPCTITTSGGRTYTDTNMVTYSTSSLSNGTYHIFKDASTGELSLYSNFIIAKGFSGTPANNYVWLDDSMSPAVLKIYNSSLGEWVVYNDLVCLGYCVIASGSISSIYNYDFNFKAQWVSKHLTIGQSTTYPTASNISYDISSYLPDDKYTYEVFLTSSCTTTSTSGSYLYIAVSSDLVGSAVFICGERTRAASTSTSAGSLILPVGTGRAVVVMYNSGYTGTFNLYARAYRRIGVGK